LKLNHATDRPKIGFGVEAKVCVFWVEYRCRLPYKVRGGVALTGAVPDACKSPNGHSLQQRSVEACFGHANAVVCCIMNDADAWPTILVGRKPSSEPLR